MQTKRRQVFKSAALIALFSFAALGSSTAAFAQEGNECHGPEGSWLYAVTIPGPYGGSPTVFQGIETYSAGGGYVEADQLSFNPQSLATAGHGPWKSTGERKFLLTYVNLPYDFVATGNPTGTSKVRQTTTLDRTGNSYSGSGDFKYYDLKGNVVFSGTFTITAKRIRVESPAND